jgi:hypothetical protein
MSSLWTPEGEQPVGRRRDPEPDTGPSDEPTEAELEALRTQLAQTPAAVVVTNHCLGLWELAALHLSLQPPQLDQASVAIDALGAVVDRLEGRLGEDEPTLRDALAQLRLAFVQVKAVADAAAAAPAGDGAGAGEAGHGAAGPAGDGAAGPAGDAPAPPPADG